MNIAFVKSTPHISRASGVKQQALSWKHGLEEKGIHVTLINCWDDIDWNIFDIILFFEYGGYLRDFVELADKLKGKIALAPIIDADVSIPKFKIAAKYLGADKLRLHSKFHNLYLIRNKINMFYARSQYEKSFISKGLGVEESKITIVPLSYRIPVSKIGESFAKEPFCFHVSRPADKGKNVPRLIAAAKKYKFDLVIAGGVNDENQKKWLMDMIAGYPNIKYLGYVTDEVLYNYYRKAKVFALPSIYEGVGLAALEAAVLGCEIVITNVGGPKEYFNNMAELVNPYDIDSIGTAIIKLLSGNVVHQPSLATYISEKFSQEQCTLTLYNSLLNIT